MSEKEITFEDALKKLEETVLLMEKGELSLDDNIKHFEKGSALSDFCSKQLKEAEKKVEVLLKVKADGTPEFKDFDTE
ncbi:MAG: exodeoxyribonuclease VII small subunit [Lentisphaeraceae bacterium]|nr:exodeoxyribonuclease VII small subunit [Lentisphaeraceae bacterium]